MCVIVYKPKGIKLDLETLVDCWISNDNGAGYMYVEEGRVYGRKGFMKFEDLIADLSRHGFLNEFMDGLKEDKSIVLHFRLATHGKVVPGQTHPFPISRVVGIMKRRSWISSVGLAHNGIIRLAGQPKNISDTMFFIQMYLAGIRRQLHKKEIQGLIEGFSWHDRFAIMFGNGKTSLIGDWEEESGVFYSNTIFQWKSYYAGKSFSKTATSYSTSPWGFFCYICDSELLPSGWCPTCNMTIKYPIRRRKLQVTKTPDPLDVCPKCGERIHDNYCPSCYACEGFDW